MRGRRYILALVALVSTAGCTTGRVEAPPPVETRASLGPVLLVGIDGATFDLILPLVAAGRLPHLGSLMERGSWAPLGTLEPTVSPAIWTTVATGREPAVHGILGFEGVPGQSMQTLPTTSMRRVRAFWNLFSDHGRTAGVVGWWVTWPAEAVRGYMVSDRVAYTRMEAAVHQEATKEREIYPPELADSIRALVREPSAIRPEDVRRHMALTDEEVQRLIHGAEYEHGHFLPEFKYVHQADRTTADIALKLIVEQPTDLTAVAFYGVDAVSHLAWHFMQPAGFERFDVSTESVARYGSLIENYYSYLDAMLGELLQAAPDDATVIVFSDHGFGPTGNLPWSGGHGRLTPGAPVAPDGVLVLAGPAIRAGAALERPGVLDITPTLLYLAGLPVANDMQGRVLTEAFLGEIQQARPVQRIPTYETTPFRAPSFSPEGDEALDRDLREKLRALGYLGDEE